MINPECEPGHDHDHGAGDVHGDHVVGELPGEHQVHLEAAVLPGVGGHVTVVAAEHLELEAPGKTHVGHKLQSRGVIPDIDHIRLGPPVCHRV